MSGRLSSTAVTPAAQATIRARRVTQRLAHDVVEFGVRLHFSPNRMRSSLRLLVAAVALVPLAATAQQAPRTLPAPDASFDEPFTNAAALRELRDGRVIVIDPREKLVQLVDFKANRGTKIGREGSGPTEYGMPMRLFTAPGDSSFIYDPLNERYLVIGPDGKPINTVRIEFEPPPSAGAGGAGGGRQIRMGGMWPTAADARGRLYFESSPITMGPDGPTSADSAAVMRYDRATKKLDTLAWVALAKHNAQVSGGSNNMRMMIGQANPMTPRDQWAVFPDGRVALIRGADYRVDYVAANGAKSRGTPIKYTPVRMGDAEKKEEELARSKARANSMVIMMTQGPGGAQRTAGMGLGANGPPMEPLTDWPAVKPAFRPGAGAAFARPNGELWVRRTEAAGAKGTLYDVIDAKGAVTHQVRLSEMVALVGFGAGTVYTTLADSDDLLTLRRHRMP